MMKCDIGLLTASVLSQFQGRNIDDDDQDSAVGESDVESSTASVASSILKYRTINGRTYHSDRSVKSDAQLYWYLPRHYSF